MKTKLILSLLFLLPLVSCVNNDSSNNSVVSSGNTSISESISVATHYKVKFLNYNNTLLQEVDVLEGGTATYTGVMPTKEEDDEFRYEFSGWDKTLTNVHSDITTKATYTAIPKENWGSVIWF